jgi:glycine dehydrogenase subunit 1
MRYLPLTAADRQSMLDAIGVKSVDELYRDVPKAARREELVDLPLHASEMEVERRIASLAAKNLTAATAPMFCGAGVYRHHVPAAVDAMIQRGEFLTSYTPYQPEVAQGTLQYLFEFQTQVALITGMEVANASLYDAATGTSEAIAMAVRITRRTRALISGGVHPHYAATSETSLRYTGVEIETLAPDPLGTEDLLGRLSEDLACVVVQNPSFFGRLNDLKLLADSCHEMGILLIVVVAEPVSLGLVTSPGEMGADIVVAEGQSIGIGLNFGGPGLGLFATRDKFLRQMPGRLCGQTVDQDGKRGWVLTLSTREQHIRREKATSNICTNSGLCALAFSVHMTMMGETGFTALAELNHAKAVHLADKVGAIKGVKVITDAFFNEFAVTVPGSAAELVEKLAAKGILGGVPASRLYPTWPELDTVLLLAATETNSDEDIDALVSALKEQLA